MVDLPFAFIFSLVLFAHGKAKHHADTHVTGVSQLLQEWGYNADDRAYNDDSQP
jgi:hypothetical protein